MTTTDDRTAPAGSSAPDAPVGSQPGAHPGLLAARDHLLELREDHARAVAEFAWPDLGERFNWAVDWFDAVGRHDDRPALVVVRADGERTAYSFADMVRRSDATAAWLAAQGVRRGDAVLLVLGNQVELWDCMLALTKIGAVVVPTTAAAGPADLADRMARVGARAVVCSPAETGKVDQAAAAASAALHRLVVGRTDAPGWADLTAATTPEALAAAQPVAHPGTGPGDRLLLYFTSGTTSRPKLVEHTHASYPVGHLSTMYWLGLRPGDVHLNLSSPGWAKHAWSCFFAPWLAQATVVVQDYARFEPAGLLDLLHREQVTSFCAPPTVWRMLLGADLGAGPGALREAIGAGEPLNPEVIAQVERAWGLTIRDGFGQTEMTAAVGNTPGSPVKPGSMGRPLPGVPVALVDPVTGARVTQPGGEGEICLDLTTHPLPLMTGYPDDEVRHAEAVAGGWYHTGDVATVDADGYLTYVGRTDDVFKSSDYKVSPFEVESVLLEHPAVAEAAVVPAPDPVRLAVVKAYVALAPGHEATAETARSVLAHARAHLAPWQRVRRLEFTTLPKTVSGKIRRVELRRREVEVADGEVAGEWRDDQFPRLGA